MILAPCQTVCSTRSATSDRENYFTAESTLHTAVSVRNECDAAIMGLSVFYTDVSVTCIALSASIAEPSTTSITIIPRICGSSS